MPKRNDLNQFGRFTEPAVLILISLAECPRHGYAIARDIDQVTGYKPGPGTLYGALGRLETRGFIRPQSEDHIDGRCVYELTSTGQKALSERLDAMAAVGRIGRNRLDGCPV
ncbi:PadR family transcriptional regulator [Microbulbifer spongiae]|uniref:PadR family transcriptional regulator n=1 Tax=Microbulbifer spongiae TaxID=2944933 RepID=A0ABY9ED11_9GAMM|nr:PadR family transcriptional regulator [Microbulbifer sp. MI-G]WKD50532.1 PadR family transcriptional regulator [Microbulbifer sp. MI-G]